MRLYPAIYFTAILTLTCCASAAETDVGFHEQFSSIDHNRWYISNGWTNGNIQSCEWRADAISTDNGNMQLTLSDRGGKILPVGCPEIHTNMRMAYGLYETRLRSAAGSGLNTAFFTYVGPPTGAPEHDEIDFEFLGKDPHTVQLNYFTNGKPQDGTVIQLGYDASKEFHDYAFEWAPSGIRWYVDHKLVHETKPGANLPHNPGRLYLSLWSGSGIEDAWLGPFHYTSPVTAEVSWAAYTPAGKPCQFPESMKCK